MFTHPSDEERLKMAALARSHPEVYNAMFEEQRERPRQTLETPHALNRLIGRIKKFFRRNQ